MSRTLRDIPGWLALGAALLVLNATLTFHNVWPTPYVRWTGELSIEIVVLLLLLALAAGLRTWRLPRWLPGVLSLLLIVALLGRYGEVTAPALYGREVNLYWDLRHVGAVIAMLGNVAPAWALGLGAAALLLCLVLLFRLLRWAVQRILEALQAQRALRLGTLVAASLLLVWFAAQRLDDRVPRLPQFSIPVSHTYAAQLGRVLDASGVTRAARRLPPSPLPAAAPAGLQGADVLLVFMESYGRVTFDRPELARIVTPARERFVAAANGAGFELLSAYFTAPTFGGASWLAHLSLMSGIETRDPAGYDLLMSQQRPSLPSRFRDAGYRSIALMPGLKYHWPEGRFYGFDHIYDAAALDYAGPAFGWWRIPDQFTLAQLDARERQVRDRRPLFVFFPTINTHMPFRPTPPLQEDWARLLTQQPYDAVALRDALAETPDWLQLGPSYAGAVAYSFDVLASYLRRHAGENLLLVLLGDHQPPAAVSGGDASWDVPVHVAARPGALPDGLRARGFVDGAVPRPGTLGPTSALPPVLLELSRGPARRAVFE